MIKQDVTSNDVFLYMKGVPEAPNCGFSDMAVKVLRAYGECMHSCMQAACMMHGGAPIRAGGRLQGGAVVMSLHYG